MPTENRILKALLRQYGYTHRSLAAEVNQVSEGIYGRPGAATDRDVRRWVSGHVRWPTTRYLLPLAEIFERPPEAMGFVPRGRSSRLPAPSSRSRPGQEDPVKRRAFLTASTATTVALALGLEQTPTRGRLTMADVDRVNQTIGRLDAHFTVIGGGALLAVATRYLDRLRDTLDGCAYGPRVEQALHSAISGLHASAGWAAYDCGDSTTSRLHHAEALQSAIFAKDGRAQIRAWSDLSVQARADGRYRDALRINLASLETRQARHNPRIAALLHSRLAIGHARVGDARSAARALLAAQSAYDRFDTADPAPPWLRFLDAAELAGLAGLAHRAVGRLPDAEIATTQALDLLGPSMHRNRAYYGVQLAELQLAQGDTTRAKATAAAVDTAAVSSPRIAGRLATVHHHLATI
ncbi:twin-arginine translocation signal domain-containing protein [Streptomyces anulatus]|uniref:twin-arginine translocation signal domain-containing protein n=2 Tax=Streptomyces TaxID=1883 RepID=UPI00386F81D7|nr:twin-arginine translocation signal domain-containing protein [Streptomyces anulatus]